MWLFLIGECIGPVGWLVVAVKIGEAGNCDSLYMIGCRNVVNLISLVKKVGWAVIGLQTVV